MAKERGAVRDGKDERSTVEDGGKRLSEERRTTSPSIRTYSRPESFPHKDTYLVNF